eukprot:GEMP01084135.1.p1 GENE.GEMP01084135.1~~GEMP01084135.1.p1  ORF type:complete len:186 (+),score=39.30 GEMP01084135.1:216-773(+)
MTRIIIIPGNGCSEDIRNCNWYGWLEKQLQDLGADVSLETMPEPLYAYENVWIPHVVNKLTKGTPLSECIIVGHSSGAVCAMRLAEQYKVKGVLLVAAYVSSMGDETEEASGYFSRPWEWAKMKENAGFITQMASKDDPLLGLEEQRAVQRGLELVPGQSYLEFEDKAHFFKPTPELVHVLRPHL